MTTMHPDEFIKLVDNVFDGPDEDISLRTRESFDKITDINEKRWFVGHVSLRLTSFISGIIGSENNEMKLLIERSVIADLAFRPPIKREER